MPAPSPDEVVHAVAQVSGRVQGVGFRWWTMRQARRHAVAGSAVNLADGRVQVHAEGPPAAVQALLADLRRGPPSARVSAVSVQWEAPSGRSGFDVG